MSSKEAAYDKLQELIELVRQVSSDLHYGRCHHPVELRKWNESSYYNYCSVCGINDRAVNLDTHTQELV